MVAIALRGGAISDGTEAGVVRRAFHFAGGPFPLSIAIHLLGGLEILVGFKTRCAAALLILLCLGTAFGVHLPAGDQANMTHFYKNLVMAGGFLYVVMFGAGAFSVDREAV